MPDGATAGEPVTVVLVDAMAGVRDGLRWVLATTRDVVVVAEAATVTTARDAPGAVVVTGLHLPDGTAADLVSQARPVVVHTWLPPDERADVELSGAAAVVRHGDLRAQLAAAVVAAAGRSTR